jgi:hypothetical protein
MERIGDSIYRGIEYGVELDDHGDWRWAFYPKIGLGMKNSGKVKGTREQAISACKAAIDKFLGPAT